MSNINKSLLITTATFFFFALLSRHTSAASPPAPSPGPASGPPPPDVYKILTKAGQFSILTRLLRSTKVGDQINNQLSTGATSSAGLTFFAPTDNAFSGLKSGTLNRLSDQQKVQLIQFHMVPTFVSISSFQTLTNPVQTQASDSYQFPLNVTTDGGGQQVNITTGLVNATISGTVFSDDAGQLAIYQVDKVLQPLGIFNPRPPPPTAPAPASKKKKAADSDDQAADGTDPDSSASASASWAAGIMLTFFVLASSFGWS